MRFIHYSDALTGAVRPIHQDGTDHRGSKPNGLWFSIEHTNGNDSWKIFCEAKSRGLGVYRAEVTFKPDARILWLRDANVIDKLTCAHGYSPECPEWLGSNPDYSRSAIRWECVANQYDVVIAEPYCLERHKVEHWYFTWDCASGCVWSPAAVAEFKQLSD